MSVKSSLSVHKDSIPLLEHEVITRIKQTTKRLTSIIEKKILILRHESFLKLKSAHWNCSYNNDPTCFKISNGCKNLIRIYKEGTRSIKINFLHKWKRIIVLEKLRRNLRSKIEAKYQNETRKGNLEMKMKKLDEDNLLLRNQINTLGDNNIKASQTIKSYEEKEEKFLNIITSLDKEKEKLSQQLHTSKGNERKISLENKSNELERKLHALQEDNKEKENYLNTYIKEMNQMLENFEELSKEITKQQEIHDAHVKTHTSVHSPEEFKISSIPSKFIMKTKQKINTLPFKCHYSHQVSKSPMYSSHVFANLTSNNKLK